MSPAKTAEPIEMPLGLRTRVGPGNHVLDGGPDPTMGRGNFDGERGGDAALCQITLTTCLITWPTRSSATLNYLEASSFVGRFRCSFEISF